MFAMAVKPLDEGWKLQLKSDLCELEFSLDTFICGGKGKRRDSKGLGLVLEAVGSDSTCLYKDEMTQ
jgi:hypothetical protein